MNLAFKNMVRLLCEANIKGEKSFFHLFITEMLIHTRV